MFDFFNEEGIKKDLYTEKYSRRTNEDIEKLYRISAKSENDIDDLTFSDLNLNEVYRKLDFTYSSPGEGVLYKLLRNPLTDEDKINKRWEVIQYFLGNINNTIKCRQVLFNLNIDKKHRLLNMISSNIKGKKIKYYLYTFLGRIFPLILIILGIALREPRFLFGLFVLCMLNLIITNREQGKVDVYGMIYLNKLFKAGSKLEKILGDELFLYKSSLKDVLVELEEIRKGIRSITICNAFGGALEAIALPLLIEEATFNKIAHLIDEKAEEIYKLYYIVGEIDALISIGIYCTKNKGYISKPKFVKEKKIRIDKGLHPILLKGVPNSITIDNNGIVLTGTNMSGKSTFLRMLGVNILLSQCFNFACTKEYEGCLFRIVSSISPSDDINSGKSYYLAEAESILRIIKALEGDTPVFCAIDEIFRGTNPVERIASSSEILKYINNRNAIAIVATHDRELTDILKHSYEFYYFSEAIDNTKGISFDYKLKKGVSKTRNAIKLLEYVGYPEEITYKAFNRVEEIERFS